MDVPANQNGDLQVQQTEGSRSPVQVLRFGQYGRAFPGINGCFLPSHEAGCGGSAAPCGAVTVMEDDVEMERRL